MTRIKVSLTTRGAIVIVLLGAAMGLLLLVHQVLHPFIWAFIIAYILDPVVDAIARRFGVRRGIAVTALYTVLLGFLAYTFFALRPLIYQEMRDLLIAMPRILASIKEYFLRLGISDILGIPIDPQGIRVETSRMIQDALTQLTRQAFPLMARMIGWFTDLLLFLVATFYFLLEMDNIGTGLLRLMPRRWRRDVIPLLVEMEQVVGAYIRGELLLMTIMGVWAWVVLALLGVHYSVVLGLLTGILEIVPTLGPLISGSIAVSVAFTQQTSLFGGNNLALAAVVGLSYAAMQQLENVFLVPQIMGRAVRLHPLVVLFALVCGAALGGALGAILAVPTAAMLKTVLRFLHTRFMEEEEEQYELPPLPELHPKGNLEKIGEK